MKELVVLVNNQTTLLSFRKTAETQISGVFGTTPSKDPVRRATTDSQVVCKVATLTRVGATRWQTDDTNIVLCPPTVDDGSSDQLGFESLVGRG
jgi:hypothetical protein